MKQIKDLIIGIANSSKEIDSQKESTKISKELGATLQIEKILSLISRVLKATYPNVFLSLLSTEAGYDDWRMVWRNVAMKLRSDEIERALKTTVLTSEFPPSPAQFVKAALGIIPADQAYAAIGQNDLATQAYDRIDSWFKKTAPEKEVKQAFIAIYKNLAEELLTGEFEE